MKRMNVIKRACEQLGIEVFHNERYEERVSPRSRWKHTHPYQEYVKYQLETENDVLFLHVAMTGRCSYRLTLNDITIALEFSQRDMVKNFTNYAELYKEAKAIYDAFILDLDRIGYVGKHGENDQ